MSRSIVNLSFYLEKKRISFKVGSPPITMHGMLLLGPKDTTNSIEHSAMNQNAKFRIDSFCGGGGGGLGAEMRKTRATAFDF
jgi:hypothetical protein